jgi:putative transposase
MSRPDWQQFRATIDTNKDAFCYDAKNMTGIRADKVPAIDVRFDIRPLPGHESDSIYVRQRKYSQFESEAMHAYYSEQLEHDRIEVAPPNSRHALQTVVAAKKDGNGGWSDTRVCLNAVPVNRISLLERWQTEPLEAIWRKLEGATLFSTLDLKSGFHQLPLTERAKQYLTFHWHPKGGAAGLYRWKVLPFGPTSGPSHFQRVVDEVFKDLPFVQAYLDDILIASSACAATGRTEVEVHEEHVRLVLERLKEVNLLAHPKKCVFGSKRVPFLGMLLTPGRMSPEEGKVKAILDLRTPTTTSELRSALGLLSYYRLYNPSHSAMAKPLNDLPCKMEGRRIFPRLGRHSTLRRSTL